MPLDALEFKSHLLTELCIEVSKRFIQEEQAGVAPEPSQGNSLALAAAGYAGFRSKSCSMPSMLAMLFTFRSISSLGYFLFSSAKAMLPLTVILG